jgi:hypothetical protein
VVFILSWKQIVDSVITLFRVDFSGRGKLAERQVFSSIHFNGSRQLLYCLGVPFYLLVYVYLL